MKKEYNYSIPIKYVGGQKRGLFKCWTKEYRWKLAKEFMKDRLYNKLDFQVNLKIILNK